MKPGPGSLKRKKKNNGIDEPIARHIKKKTERTQINKITNERGEITTNTTKYKCL